MNTLKYHDAVNSRNNQRYNPYAKFVSIPSKVIPTDTTSNQFKSNSEIVITKLGANYEVPVIKDIFQNNLDDKENWQYPKQQSFLKATNWVFQSTNGADCKPKKKSKKIKSSKYEQKRVN